jgi:diguanylate cyclase (GGDEF)-like protein
MIFGQGHYFNSHFFFLAFCTTLFTYFPLSQWRDIVLLFTINLSLFTVSHLGFFTPYPETEMISSTFTLYFSIMNIIASTFILGGMVFISENATFRSDEKLEELSTMDSLTGLLNRRGFMTRFEEECARCQRLDDFSVLMFFDLNEFKAVNDNYGHDVGDLLLQQVAKRIQGSLRTTDVVGRIGGDEFVALICSAGKNEADSSSQAKTIIEKIRDIFSEEYVLESGYNRSNQPKKCKCSSSIGFAVFNGESDLDDVFKKADKAMYADKKTYRNVS